MTKEPIMIDGVDVSGCEFLTKENYKNTLDETIETQFICGQTNENSDDAFTKNAPNLHCDRCYNCYYKQLKRKEQECEAKTLEFEGIKQQIDQLKAENDKCIKDNEYLKTIIKDFTQEVVKLKQDLQEITEVIIEFAKEDILTFPDRKPEENYKFIQEQCAEPIRQILQILQKCEVLND